MKEIFDKVSYDCSEKVTKTYSTSFSMATKLLSKSIRKDIYNIYGFVRFADEIVDSFHDSFARLYWFLTHESAGIDVPTHIVFDADLGNCKRHCRHLGVIDKHLAHNALHCV